LVSAQFRKRNSGVLLVAVHQQHILASIGAGNREVDRQCRLADTALNVTYCENHVYVAFLAF